MKWITRERPKIDRIACPWLITRFIDKDPEFIFVPAPRVLAVATMLGAAPRLFFMHFWANGEVTKLAAGLKAALDKINLARG